MDAENSVPSIIGATHNRHKFMVAADMTVSLSLARLSHPVYARWRNPL
jgi:hypothetical protein